MSLNLDPNIADQDGFYDDLLCPHEGLSKDENDAFTARLTMTLCNHIGDRDILRQAFEAAK